MNPAHDTHALLAHVGWVRSLARELVHDGATAEDLAQETLLAAFERPPRDPSAIRGYLGSILRNLRSRGARDADRRGARERRSARAEALPSAADAVERLATHRQVVEAVEALAEPYRTVVLLRYFEELSPRRIAEHLGVPLKTVETRLTRGHALLRERLDADHGGDRRAWALALARFAGAEPVGRASPRPHALSAPWIVGIGAVAAAGVVALALGLRVSAARAVRSAQLAREVERRTADALIVSKLGYTGSQGNRRSTDLPAERSRLHGRIVSTSGEGIAGAEVQATFRPADGTRLRLGSFGEAEEILGRAVSRADGSWEIDAPARGVLDVRVRAQGHGLARRPLVDPEARLEIGLAPAATLALSVADESGAAVEGARVEVFAPADPASVREPIVEGATDALGRWRSDEVPPGVFRVEVEAKDRPTVRLANVAARSGDVVEREVRLEAGSETPGTDRGGASGRGHAIVGRLLGPDGRPVAGAWVAAHGHVVRATITPTDWVDVRADATGAFALEGLRSDLPHALFVRSPGLATLVRPLPPSADGARVDLGDVDLVAGASIEGRALRDDGSPAAGAVVQIERADTAAARRAETTIGIGAKPTPPPAETDLATLFARDAIAADDGSFRVRDLAPGRWRALARFDYLRSIPVEIEVSAGSVAKDVRLEIPRGLAIEGRIVDESDRPLPGAWVLLVRKGRTLEERALETDVDGRFRIDGLEAIAYRLSVGRSPSGSESYVRAETGDLVPPSLDVVVRLARTVRLEGQVVDAAGRPLARALVDGRDAEGRDVQAVSDAAGRFHLDVAANARLDLRGNWPGPGADAGGGRRLDGTLSGVDATTVEVVLRLDGSR